MGVCASNRACEPGADDSPTPPAPRECWVNILPREEIAFPMYVVKAMHVMTMTEVEPHQALKKQGVLVEYEASTCGTAAFVSHQWCGNSNPDPHFRQLVVLQRILLRATTGTLAIRGELVERLLTKAPPSTSLREWADAASWWLWYDYFSVPQKLHSGHSDLASADCMARAIASLDEYIARCRYFIVLAPTVVHEDGYLVDYESWKRRGWCRFERLAKVLSSTGNASILLVRNDASVFEVGAEACFVEPVGRGAFSDDRDRERLCPRVRSLLETKHQHVFDAGRMQEYCYWLSVRATLLQGLPADWRSVQPRKSASVSLTGVHSADEFLRLVGCRSATDRSRGISPLLIASALGDIPVMEALMESKADPHCKAPVDAPNFLVQKGMKPEHFAAMHGHSAALCLLFQRGANVSATTKNTRCTPTHFAATFGHPAALQTLLEHRADLNTRNATGTSPLAASVTHGQFEALRWLLSAGASSAPDAHGVSAMNYAAAMSTPREVVEALVEAGVPLECPFRPLRGSFHWCIFLPMSVSYRLGRRDLYSLLGHHIKGATPLLIAAAFGNVGVARTLLACNADPLARTDSGLTMESVFSAIDPSRPKLAGLLADPRTHFEEDT